jgi:hypothetical protein
LIMGDFSAKVGQDDNLKPTIVSFIRWSCSLSTENVSHNRQTFVGLFNAHVIKVQKTFEL